MLHLEVGNTDKPQLSMVCYDCLEFLSWTVRMRSTSAMIIRFVFCFKVHTSTELCSATGKLWLDLCFTNKFVCVRPHTHTQKEDRHVCNSKTRHQPVCDEKQVCAFVQLFENRVKTVSVIQTCQNMQTSNYIPLQHLYKYTLYVYHKKEQMKTRKLFKTRRETTITATEEAHSRESRSPTRPPQPTS